MMKVVKQVSQTMTCKSVILFNWFVVVLFPPELPCAFCHPFSLGSSSCLVLGSEVEGIYLLWVWAGWVFIFFFLGGCASPCRVIESDDRKGSARAMTFKPPWGLDCSPVIWADAGLPSQVTWWKPRPPGRLEALSWAHDHVSRAVHSSWTLIPKGRKIRELLDEMSPSVTQPLLGGHCGLQPNPSWLETGPGRSGNFVAKNMNSFHLLGVKGRHPDLMSWFQSDQQNGPFFDGSTSLPVFPFTRNKLKHRNKDHNSENLFHAIVCIVTFYPFNSPLKCRYFYYLCLNKWKYSKVKGRIQGHKATEARKSGCETWAVSESTLPTATVSSM